MADTSTGMMHKFDPDNHRAVFVNFCDAFAYKYEAIAKDPPAETEGPAAWIQVNKCKIFPRAFCL